ncbi:MAG: glycerophosphodiester phosphodiesterase family protein [Polaromonas sp.]|nr:glycerophosphodiester phosphodiesterase family protein [Polaromonas sp.]
MRLRFPQRLVAASLLACSLSALAQSPPSITNIQLGPRPYFLVAEMADSPLKARLQSCANGPFRKTDFSIGHRGAAMMFPEHTKESYEAAARMGAGIVECDVTFTKDKQLVCRHAQNDLHTTTNILATPLAAKCTQPFTPFDALTNKPASAECRASDITLAEFKTLCGKMDAFNPKAMTAQEFMDGTAKWRTDLYSGPTSGTLMTHQESIALFKKLGVKMTPELKSASVAMPFEGFSQAQYAQKMVDEYKAAKVPASQVFAQSFDKNDVLYWINNEPAFGKQAVFLDDAEKVADLPGLEELQRYKQDGIQIVAPPIFALLDVKDGQLAASAYAKNAKQAGLGIIAWSLERSGLLASGKGGWYYQTVNPVIQRESDTLLAVDVLARDVGVMGIFSDWPATVTYYASCMGLK